MSAKRKFKRDYIMLEAKDLNYRYKDKTSPKAFAKIEVTDSKSVIALYAENLKDVITGYSVVAIRSDYETISLGNFNVNTQGKGEFSFDMGDNDIDIKGIAILQDKAVPLIGFKGSKIDNYEDILFPPQYEFDEVEVEGEEYEEYEEVEYIDVEECEENDEHEMNYEEYEEIEYIYPEVENQYEYEEIVYEELEELDEVEDEAECVEEDEDICEEEIKIKEKNNSKRMDEDKYIEKKIKKAKSILEKQYTNTSNNSSNASKNNQEAIKTAGVLLMPRQIKKGLKYFKEVKPFVSEYIENTRWWKIEINPTTMCGYTMPYLGYVNSLNYTMYSDAVMQSYKYRHYLFGVQYDDYNKRQYYIYAVPGKKVEQPDKGHTGFTRYQPCDAKNNSLGYWLCFVDCKARRIVK